jgi:hypothetical protein
VVLNALLAWPDCCVPRRNTWCTRITAPAVLAHVPALFGETEADAEGAKLIEL